MPSALFNNAEANFKIKEVSDRCLWFYYTQWAFSPQQKALVMDITAINLPPADVYQELKEHLLHL